MQNADVHSGGNESIGKLEPVYQSRIINLNNQSERDPLMSNKVDIDPDSFRPSSIMHESNQRVLIDTTENSAAGLPRIFSAQGRSISPHKATIEADEETKFASKEPQKETAGLLPQIGGRQTFRHDQIEDMPGIE